MDKKQVQEAIGRIDGIIGKARFTEPLLNREDHIVLSRDMQLIQQCCMKQFEPKEEPEDGGTNIIPIGIATGDEDIEGSGNSV